MSNIQTSSVADTEKHEATNGTLILADGTIFEGKSFGYTAQQAGEVVFSTSMVGYPEIVTDPSFVGQILVMTYPLVGNYGIPDSSLWEAARIHISGLIVSHYIDTPVHRQSTMTLATWLKQQHIPALEVKDTRLLTQHIRAHGAMLGKIIFDKDIPFYDPNQDNLIAQVSTPYVIYGERQGKQQKKKTLALIDCGTKRNILYCLRQRDIEVITVPWNYDLFSPHTPFTFDGVVISNGPGNPQKATTVIKTIRTALENNIPTLGICMGHQLLALAAGGETHKMKFGHRSQNQPCMLHNSPRCYITAQNHGFALSTIPEGFVPWFTNANDGSNEGIKHTTKPFMSVQFHPEAAPGPLDTDWVFDYFAEKIK